MQLDECTKALKAPKLSSEALETPRDLPFTASECTETWTMFEVGSTGQAWYGKHVKELQAPKSSGG
ncbi:hypothetical protein PISMIDRAFT_683505 [Pisolithus microcarpus 441]|uniref:Uncharacterized protein n=1 Tax=Pisolithus microcarpus 441 TaxID=765257 RepID=A0A0C9Z9G0_9AGAM|nr:hypothetical protein BKA83DRAFT_683505 [Pisolithus microcarpus]KIK19092.1 hypothetical protein PISMIDRAFT_683505 [Pisolithus microcarpus 441]